MTIWCSNCQSRSKYKSKKNDMLQELSRRIYISHMTFRDGISNLYVERTMRKYQIYCAQDV
jgi:hypothetical protein